MAIINGTSVGGMTLQADYSYTQNASANTSSVTVILKLANHYALYASALTGSYISVGGSKTNYSKDISYGGSATTTTELTRKTVTVSHNSDGTATCNIAGTFVMNGTYRGYSVGTMTVNQTITLPKIARSSSFTVPSSINTGTILSGSITPSSSAFNHKVLLKVGSRLMTTLNIQTGETTFAQSVGHDWFPSSTSGVISAVLETYNGTTLVATTSKNITANVPASVVPSVSSLTAAIAANGLNGLYVQGKTTAKLTATATAGSGSTIKSYTFSGPSMSASATTANNATTTVITTAGTLTYTVQVLDNRGRSASRTVNIMVYPYTAPNIGPVAVQRCDANGNLTQSGTYAKYTVNSSYSNVGGNNTRTVTVAYSSNNGSTYSAETTLQATSDTTNTKTGVYGGGAFALASNYIIRFTIKDAYGATKTITAPLQSAARPVNIRSNGKGVAIGGMSTKDEFEVFMPADFNSTVNIDGATTINNTLTTSGIIHAKDSIHMGGTNGQTHELQIMFSNPSSSANPHTTYIYGGNPNSNTAIGLYDALHNGIVMSYLDRDNSITMGNGNSKIFFNGGQMLDFVIDYGTSGVWSWRKWNSGRMEVYGTASQSPTALNNGTNSITVTMPISFANTAYTVTITPAKCGLFVSAFGDCNSSNDISHTTSSFVMSYKYNHSVAYTTNFNIMVVGRWK